MLAHTTGTGPEGRYCRSGTSNTTLTGFTSIVTLCLGTEVVEGSSVENKGKERGEGWSEEGLNH